VSARTQQALPCKREWMGHCHYITTMMTCTRWREEEEEEGGEIHSVPFVPRTEQKAFDDAMKEKKCSLCLSPFLMLLLLHLFQVRTDCILLHCHCTIKRYGTVFAHSVYYYQLRRLVPAHIVLRLCVIRLKNMRIE
jgi:hypothetical protein